MGTEIQGYNLSEADFKGEEYKNWNYELKGNNDILSITKPELIKEIHACLLYTSPSPRDQRGSRMPSSA